MEDQEQGDAKLEDILKSIRGVMDNHNHADVVEQNSVRPTGEKESVLELISVVGTEDTPSTEALVFEDNKRRTESEINKIAKHLGEAEYLIKGKSLDLTINELIRPLVEEWLDNNLPQIVEKVVGEEIQKMVSKI